MGEVLLKQKINLNAVNQYPKGDNIYTEGEPISSIALVIKGRVQISHDGARYVMGPGAFLAVNDVFHGEYQSTYRALEESAVYLFAVDHKDDLENILSINKDYNGFIIMSLNRVINELGKLYKDILKHGHGLYSFLTDRFKFYFESASKLGYAARKPKWVEELVEFEGYVVPDLDKINYYTESADIPIDVLKSYYSYSIIMTVIQMQDQIDLINQLNEILKEYSAKLFTMAEYLINETENSLFGLFATYAIEVVNADGNSSELMDNMDSIIEEINRTEKFFTNRLGKKININRKRMEEAYHLLITGTKDKEMSIQTYLKYSVEDAEKVIRELGGSFNQILDYSGIEIDKAKKMKNTMQDFVNIKDRLSMDDNARKIRKQLTDEYYELYKFVFLKAYNDNDVPRIVDMFLDYGYADERLLTNEQLLSLYFLKDEDEAGNINVYSIKEWLKLIYEGKKEPSKNEFDLEYQEMLTSLKNKGQLTDRQVKEYALDMERKLDYEIQNMFRFNNRTTNGQISTFTPVLHKDMLYGQLDKSFITPRIVTEAFNKLLEIDHSVFDRETLYVNKERNIEKEYIIERIYPDIILMPTVGINGIMWQDITGKKRNSPGRFMFPIFSEANLFLNVVKVCGRFRWEICRTIEGTAWNDIKVKSLTSEYSDYLQFYKKNRDLSEERKERIKYQIQKGRNNSREIFVIDYEAWINYEARGAIKLNKLVREIMATYCPFSKKLREQLGIQPIFEEAYAKFNRNRLKKIRETEGRHRLLQKDSIELTKELVDTLTYYQET
ncbi:MAG: cyclic nucleotide-binding domain-containing protein [Anaerolineaceae bacterium]|nr:MAG: cyclic nucleotide-binding domain-containing protein [Anaerolineaceae bacterium]